MAVHAAADEEDSAAQDEQTQELELETPDSSQEVQDELTQYSIDLHREDASSSGRVKSEVGTAAKEPGRAKAPELLLPPAGPADATPVETDIANDQAVADEAQPAPLTGVEEMDVSLSQGSSNFEPLSDGEGDEEADDDIEMVGGRSTSRELEASRSSSQATPSQSIEQDVSARGETPTLTEQGDDEQQDELPPLDDREDAAQPPEPEAEEMESADEIAAPSLPADDEPSPAEPASEELDEGESPDFLAQPVREPVEERLSAEEQAEEDELEEEEVDQDISMDSLLVDQSIAAVSFNHAPSLAEAQRTARRAPAPETRRSDASRHDNSIANRSTLGGADFSMERSAMLSRQAPTPLIEISSTNAEAAARATAVLKHFYQYIEEGSLHASESGADDVQKAALAGILAQEEERLAARSRSALSQDSAASHAPVMMTPTSKAKDLLAAKTPGPPGAYTFSPVAPTPATTAALANRAWQRKEWAALERALISKIEADNSWQASRDAQARTAAIRGVDCDLAVKAFLATEDIRMQDLPAQGQWSLKSLQKCVKALKKGICKYADDVRPDALAAGLKVCRGGREGTPSEVGSAFSMISDASSAFGADQSMSILAMPGAMKVVTKRTARITLEEAFARGSHSTPVSNRVARTTFTAAEQSTSRQQQPIQRAREWSKPPAPSSGITPTDLVRARQRLSIAQRDSSRAKSPTAPPAESAASTSSAAVSSADRSALHDVSNTSVGLYPTLPGAAAVRTSQGGQSQVKQTVLSIMGPGAVREAQIRSKQMTQTRAAWDSPLTARRRQAQEAALLKANAPAAGSDMTFEASRMFWRDRAH